MGRAQRPCRGLPRSPRGSGLPEGVEGWRKGALRRGHLDEAGDADVKMLSPGLDSALVTSTVRELATLSGDRYLAN